MTIKRITFWISLIAMLTPTTVFSQTSGYPKQHLWDSLTVATGQGEYPNIAQADRTTTVSSPAKAGIFNRDSIKRQGFDLTSKSRLEEANAKGDHNVWFIAASQRDKNAKVALLLKDIGGRVVFQSDEVDYIRGSLPTAKAEAFAADENVMDISIGEGSGPVPLLDHDEARNTPAAQYKPIDFLPTVDPAPEPTPGNPDDVLKREAPHKPQFLNETFSPQLSGDKHLPTKSLPVSDLATLNPYLPTYLMGAPQFINRYPNFDGRGVTIAVVGAVGDVDHPMLQYGRLIDGTMVNKVVDILDPSVSSMLSLLPENLKEITTDPDSSFTFEGQKYFAPRSGTYRFGIINSREWSSNLKLAGGLAAIWDEVRNLVWIDVHRQREFRTLTAITDYGLRQQQVRIPGQDDGLTASLVVKTYPKEHVLKVFTSSIHETQVASVAAGNAFIGSEATGVAPAAQVVYVVPSRESLIEAYLLAAKDPRVDLISSSFEPDSSLEGEDVSCEILNRIIKHYQKPVLKAAGNAGAVIDSVRGMACATEVLAIASYSTRSSEDANATSAYIANEAEYVNEEGGSGPSGLAALKPDLLAPSPNSRGTPCDATRVSRSDFEIVRCYAMGGGQTSMGAPMAAGAVALLISAAKQSGVPHGNDLLRYALMSSARHLATWPIDRQGGGLIQIGSAWEQLKSAAAHAPEEVLAAGPVSFVTAYNKTPGYGVGIYELQGWHPGDSGVRSLTLYRADGPNQLVQYQLSWLGNVSTFLAPSTVTLGLRTPVEIPIQITTREAGIHGALLRLSSRDGSFVSQFGIYIVASESLSNANHFAKTLSGEISRNRVGRVFVDVPPEAERIEIEVEFEKGKGRISAWQEAKQLKISEQSTGRYIVTISRPGVIQVLISGSEDQVPNSMIRQSYRLILRAVMAGGPRSDPNTYSSPTYKPTKV